MDFTGARDDGVAAASAGPYANHLHRAPDRPVTHHSGFFTGWMPFVMPNQQCQSTEGTSLSLVLKKLNLTQQKQTTLEQSEQNGTNTQKKTPESTENLNQQSILRTAYIRVCISVCTSVIHNTAQNSSDNLPSYPPDHYNYELIQIYY